MIKTTLITITMMGEKLTINIESENKLNKNSKTETNYRITETN